MAKVEVTTCDGCGKGELPDIVSTAIVIGPNPIEPGSLAHARVHDLCAACERKLRDAVDVTTWPRRRKARKAA